MLQVSSRKEHQRKKPLVIADIVVCISACAVDRTRLCALLLLVKDERQLQRDGATPSVKTQNQATEGWFTYQCCIYSKTLLQRTQL